MRPLGISRSHFTHKTRAQHTRTRALLLLLLLLLRGFGNWFVPTMIRALRKVSWQPRIELSFNLKASMQSKTQYLQKLFMERL